VLCTAHTSSLKKVFAGYRVLIDGGDKF
jgi:hypothetical protein